MIRLKKGPKPNVLVLNEAKWTKEYKDALAPPSTMTETIKFRYRDSEIKDALRRDSHNKCIYCEGPVGVGETDHLKPVSKHPDKVVDWDNLGLVCKECNGHKSDYESTATELVNPYEDKPEDHLILSAPWCYPKPETSAG